MTELHFAFIKNGKVENILVFADKDDALADRICKEQGYDEAVWLGDVQPPVRWSTYDGKNFNPPSEE